MCPLHSAPMKQTARGGRMEGNSSHLQFKLSEEDEGRQVGNILRGKYGFSRGMLRKLKRWQGVTLNGNLIRLKDSGRKDDIVRVTLREKEESWIVPEDLPLRVLYEDEDILVIDKEAGMLVHPMSYSDSGSVANAVLHRWALQGIEARFRPVFRLDRNTSGLLMVAKNSFANHRMVEQIHTQNMRRCYLAVVQGIVPEAAGVMDYSISPQPESGGKRVVDPRGKRAITNFWVLERFSRGTLLKLELETGRTHQIRVHLAHRGFPIYGDTLYGGETGFIDRQALHSARLKFLSPRSSEEVAVESPLPRDMENLISYLKG